MSQTVTSLHKSNAVTVTPSCHTDTAIAYRNIDVNKSIRLQQAGYPLSPCGTLTTRARHHVRHPAHNQQHTVFSYMTVMMSINVKNLTV